LTLCLKMTPKPNTWKSCFLTDLITSWVFELFLYHIVILKLCPLVFWTFFLTRPFDTDWNFCLSDSFFVSFCLCFEIRWSGSEGRSSSEIDNLGIWGWERFCGESRACSDWDNLGWFWESGARFGREFKSCSERSRVFSVSSLMRRQKFSICEKNVKPLLVIVLS